MVRAFVFPGQGSQAVGMGKELIEAFKEAAEVFGEVDEALKHNLSKIIFEGSAEELTKTSNTQPALMATSMAVVKVIEKQAGKKLSDIGEFLAGHSLGEYTALCAGGAFSLADTARLLRIRGDAMQAAVPLGKGGMAAIIGVAVEVADKICAEASKPGDECQVANDNSGEQVVISGAIEAVKRAEEIAKANGAKKFVMLNVSAPFHCKLMQPAADTMDKALRGVEINAPSLPVIVNVTAEPNKDATKIRGHLVQQVTGRVRWRETMQFMANREVKEVVELGAGKVLSGLCKRAVEGAATTAILTPKDVEEFLGRL